MAINFPLISQFRDQVIDALWNFSVGLKVGGTDVLLLNDVVSATTSAEITGDWIFSEAHFSGALEMSANTLTETFPRKAIYMHVGQISITLTLSNSSLAAMRDAEAVWIFRVMNYATSDNLEIQPGQLQNLDFSEDTSGKTLVTKVGHPWSEGSVIDITNSSNSIYDGIQYVLSNTDDTFVIDNIYVEDSGGAHARSLVFTRGNGFAHQTRDFGHREGTVVTCDGTNWFVN